MKDYFKVKPDFDDGSNDAIEKILITIGIFGVGLGIFALLIIFSL